MFIIFVAKQKKTKVIQMIQRQIDQYKDGILFSDFKLRRLQTSMFKVLKFIQSHTDIHIYEFTTFIRIFYFYYGLEQQ